MQQFKTFFSTDRSDLERKINTWIKDNNIKVEQLSTSVINNGTNVYIIYSEISLNS